MRRRILAGITWLTVSSWISSLLAAARGVTFAGILGPASYGAWGFMSSSQSLSVHGDAGVLSVATRDLAAAAGKDARAGSIAWAAVAWDAAASVALGAVWALLVPLVWGPSATPVAMLFPLLFLGMNALNTAQGVARGLFRFREAAVVMMAAGAAALAFGLVACRTWGVPGLVLSQSMTYGLAAIVLLALARLGRPALAEVSGYLRSAVAEGWKLLLPNLALQLFVSLDVLMAARLIGPAGTGQYSVALLGSSMVGGVLAGSVATVVGQHLVRSAALDDVPDGRLIWGSAASLAAVLAPACALAAMVLPPLVRWLLPRYTEAVALLPLLLAAAYYLHVQFGYSSVFVAARVPMRTVPLYAVLIVANVAVDIALVRAGWGLAGIAVGTLAVNMAWSATHPLLVRWTMATPARPSLYLGSLLAGLLPLGVAVMAVSTAGATAALAAGAAGWVMVAMSASKETGVTMTLRSRRSEAGR